jgi:glycolate oxidase subunit GlcD
VDQVIESLRAVAGRDAVLSDPEELLVYECDGLPQHKHRPRAVVFPSSTDETSEVMRVLANFGTPFTPRGAGTGLSGGALALHGGVVIELARMRGILKVDEENCLAVVQTGVVNAHVSRAVAQLGLHYVPDPSSQPTCTIGGNIAENAGGMHCLKYGTTTDHVLGVRVVLAGGEIVDLGGAGREQPGYDLLGVFIGSEGTFGIATEATVRLVPIAPAVRTLLAEFVEVNDASHAVSAIIAAGIMPAALEMMDREIIRAVEASIFSAGLPLDIGAALLIELDGLEAGIEDDAERVKSICLQNGARVCRLAHDENERKKLWAARKGAFGAVGRISPDSMIQDAVVPRSRLPEVLAAAYQIASKYQLRIANVFHAGDGNLHPLICFDSRSSAEVHRVKEAGRELMETCVRAGGSITGEHGVGLDKRDLLPLIFTDDDMDTMLRVRAAFDPLGLCNPGKIIPTPRGCGEARAVQTFRRADGETGGRGDGEMGRQGEAESQRDGGTGRQWETEIEIPGERLPITPPSSVYRTATSGVPAVAMGGYFDTDAAARRLAAIVGDQNVAVFPSRPVSPSPRPPVSASRCPSVSPSPHPPVSASASLSAAPGSIAEVCEVMKLASRERWAVVPAGAGTWLDVGNPLERANVVVSTRRLKRIIHHEPADLVAVTEGGVTLDDLNNELARNGQWLPLDPPDDGRATIGGVVATGISGAQRYGYGPPRGFVIGMRVVLADGKVVKTGGRVVKNVAGYDLCKLFTASYGTLGMIVEINFKLRPRPEQAATVIASGSVSSLIDSAHAILGARVFPVAVQLLSLGIARAVGGNAADGNSILILRFAGNNKTVQYQTYRALSLLQNQTRMANAEVRLEDADIWQALAAVPLQSDNQFSWRASLSPSALAKFIRAVSNTHLDSFPSLLWHADIAAGQIRMIDNSMVAIDKRVDVLRLLRRECQASGGSLVLENAPAQVKERFDAWGELGTSGGLMRRVKEQLDPTNILSPGRFIWR